MGIGTNLDIVNSTLKQNVTLVAVSKTKPNKDILEAYKAGQRIFGENKALELRDKHASLPKDIKWHMIGRLQTNKVKYIAPFVSLIHSVDSERLIAEINKRAKSNNRVIDVLIQVHIAREDSKTGFLFGEAFDIISKNLFAEYTNVNIRGFMGMGTNTSMCSVVEEEFGKLHHLFNECKSFKPNFDILSMGMSNDYEIAMEHGSTMVRLGSSIFGDRNYAVQ